MLLMETFAMRKRLLTLFLVKPRQSAEESLENYELFIYGDLYQIINSFCKYVAKIATP